MTDIVERLRSYEHNSLTEREAADEIERLKLIRNLLIKSLAVAIGCEETDAALLTGPLTAAVKFRAALTGKCDD